MVCSILVRRILSILMVAAIGVAGMVSAAAIEPADNIIRNALIDIEKYESQAAGLTPSRASNANRILKLMALSKQRLDGSPHKDDPSWTAVNGRYLALEAQLNSLLNPSTSTAAAAAPSSAPSSAAASIPSSSPGSDATPTIESAAAQAVPLVSGERVRVKKLARDMASARSDMTTSGPSPLQDANIVAARQKSLQQFAAALERYPQLDDPDVQAAHREYEALRKALSAEYERAREQLAQLGDVQQALATIEENGRQYAPPAPLAVPFSESQAASWVEAAGRARTVAEHNLKQLAAIQPNAYLPRNPGTPQSGAPYDSEDVNRLQRNSQENLNRVQAAYVSMANDLDLQMDHASNQLRSRWQENPDDDAKRWLYIAASQQEEARQFYDQLMAIANSSIYLERALGREPDRALALARDIDAARADFSRKRDIALRGSRLPTSKSENPEMLAIARQILENPEYEFGEFGRIVLTTDGIVEREREDSEIEIDDAELTAAGDLRMSGTETTWTYRWQEFKFAAPLRDPTTGGWTIWWFTAKNFSSGGPRTPLNRWLSGEATEGNPILPENL